MMDILTPEARANLLGQGLGKWVEDLPGLAERVIREQELRPLCALRGGKGGAVLLAESGEREVILKFLPRSRGQAAALHALRGRRAPRLLASGEGWLLLEVIDGEPLPRRAHIDLQGAREALRAVWDTPLESYRETHLDITSGWLGERWETALPLIEPGKAGDTHIHGDAGAHNFLSRRGEIIAIDHSGARGPREWDLGSLAVWSGPLDESIWQRAERLGGGEVFRWALVRLLCSLNLAEGRGDEEQAGACRESLRALLPRTKSVRALRGAKEALEPNIV